MCRLYINLACLSVRLYPINFKTAEPIGPTNFVGSRVTPGKVYEWLKFKNLCLKVFFIFVNIFKILKIRNSFFYKIRDIFFSLFFNVTMRKCSQLKKKMDAKRPKKPIVL